MFGIVLSALNSLAAWIFRSIVVKFAVYFALYFVCTEFFSVIGGILPNASNLNSAFGGFTSGMWYFFDLLGLSTGLPMLISALAARFIIRRIPIIG